MSALPETPPPVPPGAPEPPWRLRSWSPVTSGVGRDDGALWRRWWPALLAADAAGATLVAAAALLDVHPRRLLAARAWLRAHAPAWWAALRPREHIAEVRKRTTAAKPAAKATTKRGAKPRKG